MDHSILCLFETTIECLIEIFGSSTEELLMNCKWLLVRADMDDDDLDSKSSTQN